MRKYQIGDRVTKTKGSQWTGRIVGFYRTRLTPFGYCVESENEPGSVQIYPEAALDLLLPTSPASPLPAEVEVVARQLDGLDRHDEAFGLGELLDQAAALIRSLAQLETVKGENAELRMQDDPAFTYAFVLRAREAEARATALQSELDKARAEVARMRDWQPIETAPKDRVIEVVGRYEHATAGFPRYVMWRDDLGGGWFVHSRHEPERVVAWAWRERTDWPDEDAIRALGEDGR